MDFNSSSWPRSFLFENCFYEESIPELLEGKTLIEKPPPLWERELFESSISTSVETPTYETRIEAEVFELQRPLNQTATEIKSAALQILGKRSIQPYSQPKGWIFVSQPPNINVLPITPSNDYHAQLNSQNWVFINSDDTDETTDMSALELSQEDILINTPLHAASFDEFSDAMFPSSKRSKLRESGPSGLGADAKKTTPEMETKVTEFQGSLTPSDASTTLDKKPDFKSNLWTCVYWNCDNNAPSTTPVSEAKHIPNPQQLDWLFDPSPEDIKTSSQQKKRKRKSAESKSDEGISKRIEEIPKLSVEDQRKLLKQRLLAKQATNATNPPLK